MQTGKKGAHRLTSERHFPSWTVIRSLDRGATGDWHEDTAVTVWDGSGRTEASGTERDKARQDSGKKKDQKHETNE